MAAELNATAASLLGFLHRGDMTGWDLDAHAQMLIGPFWSLTRSQVYRELKNLEERGLVRALKTESRDRRPFAITPRGRQAFARWGEDSPGEETIRIPLLLVVALGGEVPRARLDAHLARHRKLHAERLDAYRQAQQAAAAAPDADPWSSATLDFGLRYEQAVLDWFDGLPDLLP